jgi:hypothetical protein
MPPPMSRAETAAHVEWAHARFRARVADVKWWFRNEIAAAAHQLARALEPVDFSRAEAIGELAQLLEVPAAERDGAPSSRTPTVIRHNEPEEDDDKMRELRARARGG